MRPTRALTWAHGQGRGDAFFTALGAATFTRGEDPTETSVLSAAAAEAGLHPGELAAAIATPAVKAALREATDVAWDRGVRGAPTLAVNGTLVFGDDRLEEAARSIEREAPDATAAG